MSRTGSQASLNIQHSVNRAAPDDSLRPVSQSQKKAKVLRVLSKEALKANDIFVEPDEISADSLRLESGFSHHAADLVDGLLNFDEIISDENYARLDPKTKRTFRRNWPNSRFGGACKTEYEKRELQRRKTKRIEELDIHFEFALKIYDAATLEGENEESRWTKFVDKVFRKIRSAAWIAEGQKFLTPVEAARQTRYEAEHRWELGRELLRITGPQSPVALKASKLDRYLALSTYRNETPRGFGRMNHLDNFNVKTLDILGKGRLNGLVSSPRMEFSKRDKDRDVACFPYAVIEIKKRILGKGDIDYGYAQIANGAATSLSLLTNLCRHGNKLERQTVQPVVGFTFIGPAVKIWVAYAKRKGCNRRFSYHVHCILNLDLRILWDALRLVFVLEHLQYWALHIFKPWVSNCISQWRHKHPEFKRKIAQNSDKTARAASDTDPYDILADCLNLDDILRIADDSYAVGGSDKVYDPDAKGLSRTSEQKYTTSGSRQSSDNLEQDSPENRRSWDVSDTTMSQINELDSDLLHTPISTTRGKGKVRSSSTYNTSSPLSSLPASPLTSPQYAVSTFQSGAGFSFVEPPSASLTVNMQTGSPKDRNSLKQCPAEGRLAEFDSSSTTPSHLSANPKGMALNPKLGVQTETEDDTCRDSSEMKSPTHPGWQELTASLLFSTDRKTSKTSDSLAKPMFQVEENSRTLAENFSGKQDASDMLKPEGMIPSSLFGGQSNKALSPQASSTLSSSTVDTVFTAERASTTIPKFEFGKSTNTTLFSPFAPTGLNQSSKPVESRQTVPPKFPPKISTPVNPFLFGVTSPIQSSATGKWEAFQSPFWSEKRDFDHYKTAPELEDRQNPSLSQTASEENEGRANAKHQFFKNGNMARFIVNEYGYAYDGEKEEDGDKVLREDDNEEHQTERVDDEDDREEDENEEHETEGVDGEDDREEDENEEHETEGVDGEDDGEEDENEEHETEGVDGEDDGEDDDYDDDDDGVDIENEEEEHDRNGINEPAIDLESDLTDVESSEDSEDSDEDYGPGAACRFLAFDELERNPTRSRAAYEADPDWAPAQDNESSDDDISCTSEISSDCDPQAELEAVEDEELEVWLDEEGSSQLKPAYFDYWYTPVTFVRTIHVKAERPDCADSDT